MLYHGFYIKITPVKNIMRENDFGNTVSCRGFKIEIFSDSGCADLLDSFFAAEGFEIISAASDEAEQFAKDVIDLEQKNLLEEKY